jgi:hypothetical protein
VRQILIRVLMPLLFCTLPFLIAALVILCIPRKATEFFIEHMGLMEMLILVSGTLLFCVQMMLCWTALRWRETSFDDRADKWLTHFAQAAEWFPMLGLIGTVAGILDAFATHGSGSIIQPRMIAPAITATGAGLFMALVNILPTWIVLLGRDMILLLSGAAPEPPGESS